jgi:hypothetical protein
MNGVSADSFSSWIVQMPGWLSEEAARASRQNRSSAAVLSRLASVSSLMATCRPSFWSTAS